MALLQCACALLQSLCNWKGKTTKSGLPKTGGRLNSTAISTILEIGNGEGEFRVIPGKIDLRSKDIGNFKILPKRVVNGRVDEMVD